MWHCATVDQRNYRVVQFSKAHKTINWDDRLLSICEQRGKARLAMFVAALRRRFLFFHPWLFPGACTSCRQRRQVLQDDPSDKTAQAGLSQEMLA